MEEKKRRLDNNFQIKQHQHQLERARKKFKTAYISKGIKQIKTDKKLPNKIQQSGTAALDLVCQISILEI